MLQAISIKMEVLMEINKACQILGTQVDLLVLEEVSHKEWVHISSPINMEESEEELVVVLVLVE